MPTRLQTAEAVIGNNGYTFPLLYIVVRWHNITSFRRSGHLLPLIRASCWKPFQQPTPMGFYGKRKSVSRATSPDVVQKAFIVLWCLTIIWCEVGFFHLSLKDCQWPEKRLKASVRCHFSFATLDLLDLNRVFSGRVNSSRMYWSFQTPRSRTPPSHRHGSPRFLRPSTTYYSTCISRRAGTLRCTSNHTT